MVHSRFRVNLCFFLLLVAQVALVVYATTRPPPDRYEADYPALARRHAADLRRMATHLEKALPHLKPADAARLTNRLAEYRRRAAEADRRAARDWLEIARLEESQHEARYRAYDSDLDHLQRLGVPRSVLLDDPNTTQSGGR